MHHDDQLAELARAWDDAAQGYDAYFVPRFAPWAARAVAALDRPLPPGALSVPCAGTGPELVALAERHADRTIVGRDLSPGMVAIARTRTARYPNVRVEVGDASDTSAWEPCAAVLSVFGLQQLLEPAASLRAWARALVTGGVLSVVYWPESVESDGPFAWAADFSWERELVGVLREAGCLLLVDERVEFELVHDDAESFLAAYCGSGPGRVAAARGATFADALRAELAKRAPSGPIRHRPGARHLVARRDTSTLEHAEPRQQR